MLKSKIFAVLVLALTFVAGHVVPARATGGAPPALPANCDPAVMENLSRASQQGFDEYSRSASAMFARPMPSLGSFCQQMVNNVWNPQRFIQESGLAALGAPFIYSLPIAGFSLSFNPVTMGAQALLSSLMQRVSLGFICTDNFGGIGNALRFVQFGPNGQIQLSAPAGVTGPASFATGFMNGAQIRYNGDPRQIFDNVWNNPN